jgi:hypothetical protein
VGTPLHATIRGPEIPAASIHNRLHDASTRHRSHVLIACALAAIIILGSGTVLAAIRLGGVRIWLLGDTASVAMHTFVYVQNPNADDLRRVTSDATFPVVLPVGIPKGMHMERILFSPADHPNFINVLYRNAKTDVRSAQFILFDSSIVNYGDVPALPNGEKLPVGQVTHWKVGQENVIAVGAGQQTEIKTAMSGTTPAESLAQNLPMLYRITVLADQDRLADAAELIAPSAGRGILVDRDDLSQIASAAQSHKALRVVRATMFDTYPIVAGKPDFGSARRRRTTETAVSVDGVRAIAALLASHVCGSGSPHPAGFTCEMLINERSGRAYWIWVLPVTSGAAPTRYIVDSKTFRVEQAQ